VRELFSLLLLGALATPASAQSLELLGYAGVLGEWEVTANVTGRNDRGLMQFSGPLTMKHVGLCTQEGPEEKTGEMRFRLSNSSSRMEATLLVDGVECTYRARLSGSYTGTMNCPDKRMVPLTLWVK
jgi:hypothetical protein